MKETIFEIIREQANRDDYEKITESLLFEQVSYDTAIEAMMKIAKSDLFDELSVE